MSGPSESDDVLAQARSRLDAVRTARAHVRAEIAVLRGDNAAQTAEGVTRLRELETRAEELEGEMELAHAALGRAILEQFERDLSNLRIPLGDPDAARELTTMAENLRRACLTVLADWPELQDEARRRLVLKPSGPTTLHG